MATFFEKSLQFPGIERVWLSVDPRFMHENPKAVPEDEAKQLRINQIVSLAFAGTGVVLLVVTLWCAFTATPALYNPTHWFPVMCYTASSSIILAGLVSFVIFAVRAAKRRETLKLEGNHQELSKFGL